MLNSNDIALIRSLIADGTRDVVHTSSDDTPTAIDWTYELTAAELVTVEVVCRAMKGGTGGYIARKVYNFFYDGSTVQQSAGFWGYVTDEYFGDATTATFAFTVTDNVIGIEWTGEAAAAFTANFRIQLSRMVNTDVVLP